MTLKKLIFLSSTLFFLLVPFVAFAQSPEGGRLDLTVSPPVFELVAKPGQSITQTFRVRNNLNEKVELQIKAKRLISDPTTGDPIPDTGATGEELKWVSFDSPDFTANPNEWKNVTFTIDVPESAAFGYYYVFSIAPKQDSEATVTGSQIKGEILVVALLTVMKEGANSKTDLVSFKVKNNISEQLPVEFLVKLANRGNVHVKARGNIFITRKGGEEIGILEVNENLGSILPGGQREFSTVWNDGFIVDEPVMDNGNPKMDENGKPVTKLTIHWNKLTSFRIGPYNAKLLMVYDDGTRDVTIEGSTTFWVIPYKAIGVIAVGLIIIFLMLRAMLRSYVKKAIKSNRR